MKKFGNELSIMNDSFMKVNMSMITCYVNSKMSGKEAIFHQFLFTPRLDNNFTLT